MGVYYFLACDDCKVKTNEVLGKTLLHTGCDRVMLAITEMYRLHKNHTLRFVSENDDAAEDYEEVVFEKGADTND